MPRKVVHIIYIGKTPPEICKGCRLCVHRPYDEIPQGSKWTYLCLMDYHKISGRGRWATGGCHCRTRSGGLSNLAKRMWPKDGRFKIGVMTAERYHLRMTEHEQLTFAFDIDLDDNFV